MSRALLENHAESKQLLKKNFLTCYSCSHYSSTIIVFSFLVKYWKLIYFFDKKETLIPTISFIIFWDFLMFYQLFVLPQVKRWAIITSKHGIYELPHELANHLRLRILKQILSLKKKCRCMCPLRPHLPPPRKSAPEHQWWRPPAKTMSDL